MISMKLILTGLYAGYFQPYYWELIRKFADESAGKCRLAGMAGIAADHEHIGIDEQGGF